MVVAATGAIVQCRQQDAFVEVRGGTRDRQRPEQSQDARAAADLGRARGTTLDVSRETGGIGREKVIEQERIDEFAGVRAVQGMTDVRVRHITYMTAAIEKVARACRNRARLLRSAPQRLLRTDPEFARMAAVAAHRERFDA
jgi:hypothetical protein